MQELMSLFGPMLAQSLAGRVSSGGPPSQLVLRVAKDDKKGMQLVALIESLATRIHLPSGLTIEKAYADADSRVALVLEAVRDYLEGQGVDFDALYEEAFGRTPNDLDMPSESEMGKILHLIFAGKTPVNVAHIPPAVRTQHLNRADSMRGRD